MSVIGNQQQQQQQQQHTPILSTPINPQQQQQQHFQPAARYFPHTTFNNTPTKPATLPTIPHTTSDNYHQQPPATTDYLKMDTTFTVTNGNNNDKIKHNEDYDRNKTRYPTSSEFADFSIDSLVPQTAFTMNQTAEESIHASSTPLLSTEYPPPDLISNNMEFTRTMRKWVSAKEKDDDFFEEEQRYLKSLLTKRLK